MRWLLEGLALTLDSKTVLAAVNPDLDPDHAVLHLWDVSNGREVQAADLTGTKAESVRFAPDGRTLFTLSGETITLRSWPQAERCARSGFPERTEGLHGPGDDSCHLAGRIATGHDGAARELVAWHGY